MTWEKKKILVTVKAAPEPSRSHKEGCLCTAGITDQGEFIRLYPVSMNLFWGKRGIRKFDWVEVECKKATEEKLGRKESYKVKSETMKVIDDSLSYKEGRRVNWEMRNNLVLPLKSDSVERLEEEFERDKTSLGLIKVGQLLGFYAKDDVGRLEEETRQCYQAIFEVLNKETTGLKTIPMIQKSPHIFSYVFECEKKPCRTHDMVCLDWELSESYRKWRKQYREEDIWSKLVQTFYEKFRKSDLHFFLGTHSQYKTWMVIGTYRPPLARTVTDD